MKELRCRQCSKLLGKYRGSPQLEIKCPRCGYLNVLSSVLTESSLPPKEIVTHREP